MRPFAAGHEVGIVGDDPDPLELADVVVGNALLLAEDLVFEPLHLFVVVDDGRGNVVRVAHTWRTASADGKAPGRLSR